MDLEICQISKGISRISREICPLEREIRTFPGKSAGFPEKSVRWGSFRMNPPDFRAFCPGQRKNILGLYRSAVAIEGKSVCARTVLRARSGVLLFSDMCPRTTNFVPESINLPANRAH